MSEKGGFEIQNKRVEYDNIAYLLNDEENTAGVIGCKKDLHSIIIPTTINHESKEYYVTSILEGAFRSSDLDQIHFSSDSKLQTIDKEAFLGSKIKIIRIPSSVTSIGESSFMFCEKLEVFKIPDDSKLQIIDKKAFVGSKIKSIRITSELVELKEGWCSYTKNLTQISVSPKNPRYFCYKGKMIIGKSRIEQSNYDLLVFCVRDIQQIKIPNFIEHICPYSFDDCHKLESIEFSNYSKLQTIDKYAFCESSIKFIRIPSSVTSIGEYAFHYCEQLKVLEIPNDSKLQTIGEYVFSYSIIASIRIPSELVELKDGWCNSTLRLTKISVSPKNPRYCFFDGKMIIGKSRIEQSNYDLLVFCVRDIQQIKIPNFIEHICPFAFEHCKKLKSIEFSNDSKLQTIDKYAFSDLTIKSIRIPSSVTSIGENAFHSCFKLENIEIPDDSKLQTIDDSAFCDIKIENIRIPSELVELKEGWCYSVFYLTKISVSPNNPRYFCYEDKMIIGKSRIEQSNYDLLVFCVRDIRQFKIPNFIEHICKFAFDNCRKLESIEIPDDSKLQTIDKYAFSFSLIRRIIIPSSVTSIEEDAFFFCLGLERIEFPDDSKLQIINKKAFALSIITSIRIPSSVISIEEDAFSQCIYLQIIEVANTEMIFMYQTTFIDCTGALLMVPVNS